MSDINKKLLKAAHENNRTFIANFLRENSNFNLADATYESGDTLLHVSARLGHVQVLEAILAHTNCPIDIRNKDNKTALHEACQFCQLEAAKLLLERKAAVNALKKADWTPLMLACVKASDFGGKSEQLISYLVENGAVLNYTNKDGWSVVHLICRDGSSGVLTYLLDKGAHALLKTKNGRSALHVAALHGRTACAEILIKNGLSINDRDNCGNTPLHEAVLGGSLEMIKYFIEVGADKNCVNYEGFTVLHLAASEALTDVIKYIVDELAFDLNVKSKNGFTPLHCAAKKGHRSAYSLLVCCGANESSLDKYQRRPVDYFCE